MAFSQRIDIIDNQELSGGPSVGDDSPESHTKQLFIQFNECILMANGRVVKVDFCIVNPFSSVIQFYSMSSRHPNDIEMSNNNWTLKPMLF